jgi:DegV family protein with EDD domain
LSIKIITDSTSDIPLEDQKSLGIDIVSLNVIFDDKKYTDCVDLKKKEFYEMLSKAEHLPTTSQVNPDGFQDLFKSYIDAGDDIIGIFISSKLSGTYQSACIVQQALSSDRIYVVDSKSATFGLALLVYEAIRQRDKGVPAKEIYDSLMTLRDKIEFYAVVDTLKYLKMGGRLSSSAAILGGMLNIKPLVSIIDGEVKSPDKARGQNAAFAIIAEKIKERLPDKSYPIVFGHSNDPNLMGGFIKYISGSSNVSPDYVCEIGCVIGTHAGPGCVGLAYVPVD